ncbi:MAG: ribbon-helix-helix protein, CopG family [Deltaproteobacteria bacterium]|nr:ribbon-helix-helix protein, CopG family [Deltaproteobacteria bacterium]
MKPVKFATQLDADVADKLRSFAAETDRSISKIVNEAVAEYLARYRVRPAFRTALDEVITEHAELLERLAK